MLGLLVFQAFKKQCVAKEIFHGWFSDLSLRGRCYWLGHGTRTPNQYLMSQQRECSCLRAKFIVNPSSHILQDQFATWKHIGSLPSWEDDWLLQGVHTTGTTINFAAICTLIQFLISSKQWHESHEVYDILATCCGQAFPSFDPLCQVFGRRAGLHPRGSLHLVWLQSPPCQSVRGPKNGPTKEKFNQAMACSCDIVAKVWDARNTRIVHYIHLVIL